MSKALNSSYKVIQIFRKINTEMPSQQIAMFLRIASYEGVTLPELAEALNTTVASVSRNGKILSEYMEKGELKGYGLIGMRPDIRERRRLACFLTDKGRELVAELDRVFK
ncbi:DNA-binding transcriptional regulator, MarR family [Malonomonas rubra DSM 5091]|uniref:DNA-binding transcriptional regulator, MarR family n=1 Tax=Malonomonas rubra DSM 5091 TaxID=1122189 RepID=A0A1M6L834_MALRU|nr:hypothetical protein [Malonomonas rubra]SHJ67336.1 DNA-binding transcriptional regulator, MarR family [Malonomonas rubra DSM 5091]